MPPATIRFLADWRETLEGALRRGESLSIEYDPARLPYCRQNWRGAEVWNIEVVARLHPRGEILSGSVLKALRDPPDMGTVIALVPAPFVLSVPADTTQIELWFHNFSQTSTRCDAWDSRFGRNYWFVVGGDPLRALREPVSYRAGAIASPDMVSVVSQDVVKKNVSPRAPTGVPAGRDLATFALVTGWVKNVAYAKNVWMDVHVFDQADARISSETFKLRYAGSAGGTGDLFTFDGAVYRGTIATPGSASPKPDARIVQYRLYYEVLGQVFTDAILHQQYLTEDAVTA